MDFMTMTIHPLPLSPRSSPHRLTFHWKDRMGQRWAKRMLFISENHKRIARKLPQVELDLK